jgi:hypothetical protein
MPRLAERISGMGGLLGAAVLTRAAASLHNNPEEWREWGDHLEVLRLRQLWSVGALRRSH